MNTTTIEIISTVTYVICGVVVILLWRIWPSDYPSIPFTFVDILKTIFGGIFLVSGIVAFVMQIIGITGK